MDRAERDAIEARLQEEAEQAAMPLLPTTRHDMVGTWPGDKLGDLISQRPDLLPELRRRRPSEVTQL